MPTHHENDVLKKVQKINVVVLATLLVMTARGHRP